MFNKQIELGNLSVEIKKDNKFVLIYDMSFTSEHKKILTVDGENNTKVSKIRRGCGIEQSGGRREYNLLISYIIDYMIGGMMGEYSVYFPTARTGYVLTYKSLVRSALRDKFNHSATQKNLLTKPNSDFLSKLSGITWNDVTDDEWHMINRTQTAVNIIESNIIGGRVTVSDMPAHDIMYRPDGTDVQLPMFVTSGVVTEMTPLLLFFRNEVIETVLIEEPEISLHPQLQCEIARVIIRLVNSEIPVVVTTHSDIILQHINNMMKLSGAENRKAIGQKLGFEKCDWIEKEKVNV